MEFHLIVSSFGVRDFSIIQNNRSDKFLELPFHAVGVQVPDGEAQSCVG
jgi:hypothetical protein